MQVEVVKKLDTHEKGHVRQANNLQVELFVPVKTTSAFEMNLVDQYSFVRCDYEWYPVH